MLVDTRGMMTDCKSDAHMAATKADLRVDRRATQMVGWMADTQAVLTVL